MTGLLYIVSAFGLGALHALEPGHGKTMVAAYLIGSKGRPRDAILLGIVVTITHTLGVLLLALLTLTASAYFVPQQVEHALEVVSGILVLAVGLWLVWQRVLAARWETFVHDLSHRLNMVHAHPVPHGHSHDEHSHSDHEHDHHDHSHEHHEHEHGHSHDGHNHQHGPILDASGNLDLRGLIALGISGGIVPCPGALVVLLTAVAAGGLSSILSGLGLVVVFSLGLASVLIAMGLALVASADWLEKRTGIGERFAGIAGQASAWLILVLGIYLTVSPFVAS